MYTFSLEHPRLTSVQVRVRLVGPQEHGLAWIQDHVVEEVDGEAADVSGELGVEAEQQVAVAAGRVLPCCACRGHYNQSDSFCQVLDILTRRHDVDTVSKLALCL